MKKLSVTTELKKIVEELGVQYETTFSDNLSNNRVSVKFSGAYFTDEQKEIVRSKMEEKGFVFQFTKGDTASGWSPWEGTRFCFTKIL
jgi:hypothetical protein